MYPCITGRETRNLLCLVCWLIKLIGFIRLIKLGEGLTMNKIIIFKTDIYMPYFGL